LPINSTAWWYAVQQPSRLATATVSEAMTNIVPLRRD
jgi:hypothetical protein